MDYSKLNLFSLIQQKMSYIGERQTVLAQNIANTDTPKYKAQDLKSADFSKLVAGSKLQMVATNAKHIQPKDAGEFALDVPKTTDPKPNGNTVDPIEEAQKMSDNNMDYQSVTSVYAKMADLIRTVASDK